MDTAGFPLLCTLDFVCIHVYLCACMCVCVMEIERGREKGRQRSKEKREGGDWRVMEYM